MCRPFRRYAFYLAERLGLSSPEELYTKLDSYEIAEWMAFDQTQNPDWIKSYEESLLDELSVEEQAARTRAILGGTIG